MFYLKKETIYTNHSIFLSEKKLRPKKYFTERKVNNVSFQDRKDIYILLLKS